MSQDLNSKTQWPEDFSREWFAPGALETEPGFAVIYNELRAIARYLMRGEAYTPTLDATELVNDAFAKLYRNPISLNDRRHALAILSRYMRQLLVDRARRRGANKRSGERVTLNEQTSALLFDPEQWQIVVTTLKTLEEHDERLARVFELRYFVGLSNAEAAEIVGCSERTAKRCWQAAKAWLHSALGGGHQQGTG